MSDDLKSSAEGTEAQENEPEASDVTEELVDEVADSLMEGAETASADTVPSPFSVERPCLPPMIVISPLSFFTSHP